MFYCTLLLLAIQLFAQQTPAADSKATPDRAAAPQARQGRRLLPLHPGPHVRGAGGGVRPQRTGQQSHRGIPAGHRRRSHFRVSDLRAGRALCQDRPHSRRRPRSAGHSQARSQQPGSAQAAGPHLSAFAGRHAGRARLAERSQAGHRAVRTDHQDRARQCRRSPSARPPLPPEQRSAEGGGRVQDRGQAAIPIRKKPSPRWPISTTKKATRPAPAKC